jgi:hypothetical protein
MFAKKILEVRYRTVARSNTLSSKSVTLKAHGQGTKLRLLSFWLQLLDIHAKYWKMICTVGKWITYLSLWYCCLAYLTTKACLVGKITCQQMTLPYDRSPQSWGHTSPQISLARTALYKREKASETRQTLNLREQVPILEVGWCEYRRYELEVRFFYIRELNRKTIHNICRKNSGALLIFHQVSTEIGININEQNMALNRQW